MLENGKPNGEVIRFKEVSGMNPNEFKKRLSELDKPLNTETKDKNFEKPGEKSVAMSDKTLDKPLDDSKKTEEKKLDALNKEASETKEMVVIEFRCPEGVDRKEFLRQLKAQERGLNSQTVAENMDNRAAFEKRKEETGNGRDTTEGGKAQEIARKKAIYSRMESNQKKGMSPQEAKAEAENWIKTQAALHNPDQIAGGDPAKVSRMGDSAVNSSIGSQWKSRVHQLAEAVDKFAEGKTREELENTKMNVKLVMV